MRFSVVIPTFNEEAFIVEAVTHCRELKPAPQIVVIDGGSRDRTVTLATSLGIQPIQSRRRGRAFQMNEGVDHTEGDVLVFLHADTRLNQKAWDRLQQALQNPKVEFGAFKRRFHSPSLVLNTFTLAANLRGYLSHVFLGDQIIFVRRPAFERIGGYREILLFEDLDICVRLRRIAKGRLIDAWIDTSRRRFEAEGDVRRYWKNIVLWLQYLMGVDPDELARRYYPGYYNEARKP